MHLCRRAVGSYSNASPSHAETDVVRRLLLPGEMRAWLLMQGRDQRHSILVLERFVARRPHATREEQAAALLHDVGKSATSLGWFGRIGATIFGPCTPRMRTYLEHELIGLRMLEGVSEPRTLRLLSGDCVDDAREDLLWADET